MANLGFSVDAVVSDMLMPDARRVGAREMQVISAQSVDATPDQRSFGIRKVIRRVVQTLSGSRLRITALIREYVASTTQCSGGGRGAITLPEDTNNNRDANRSIPEAMDILVLKNDQERLDAFFNLNVDRFVEVLIEQLTGQDIDNMSRASTSFARIAALIYQRRTMLDRPSFYRLGPLDSLMGVGRVNIGAMQHAESLVKAIELATSLDIINQPTTHVTHMSMSSDPFVYDDDDGKDSDLTKFSYVDDIARMLWSRHKSSCVQLDFTFVSRDVWYDDIIRVGRCKLLKSLRVSFKEFGFEGDVRELYSNFMRYSEIPLIENVSVILEYDFSGDEEIRMNPEGFLDSLYKFEPNKIRFYIEGNVPISDMRYGSEDLRPGLIFRKVEIVYNGEMTFYGQSETTVNKPMALAFILRTPQSIKLNFSEFTKLVWIEKMWVKQWRVIPGSSEKLDVLVGKNLNPKSKDIDLPAQTTYISQVGVTSFYVVNEKKGTKAVLLNDRDMTSNPMDISEWRVAYNKYRTNQ